MATIDITTQSGAVGTGDLQLQNGAPMDGTLRLVTDAVNTPSPLRLSTTNVTSYGGGAITSNTAFGDGALDSNTTGFSNTAFGGSALTSITTGKGNSAFGYLALTANTGDYNTATGNGALYANTSGENNTGVGNAALFYNTSGTYNTGIGASALLTNSTGNNNTATGYRALYANTTGAGNTATGTNTMRLNQTGTGNSAFGYLALENNTNSNNTALGYRSLRDNTSGTQNTAIGVDAGLGHTTGSSNTYLGYGTGAGITTGSNNTILGANVSGLSSSLSNTIILADGAGNQRIYVDNAGNVGIGTTSPVAKLQTTGYDAASIITGIALENFISTNPPNGNGVAVDFRLNNSGNASPVVGKISTVNTFFRSNADMVFSTFTSDILTEKLRIVSSGGITFNGDTAAANALDDYEEGTWTIGVSFGGGSTGVVYATSIATYTKIGRQVTVNGLMVLTNKGTSTGSALITGLPFTIANGLQYFPATTLRIENITFVNQFQGYGSVSSTNIALEQVTNLGANSAINDTNFANNSTVMVSLTYFV